MKTITGRVRKILSRIFRVISVSVASLILQACYGILPPDDAPFAYGMPPPDSPPHPIAGKVISSENGSPIPGIEVSIEGTKYSTKTSDTGYTGLFQFDGIPYQETYIIRLKDVDGPANGGLFYEKTETVKYGTFQVISMHWDSDRH